MLARCHTPHGSLFSSRSLTCNKYACITQPATAAVPSKNANAALLVRCHTPHCSPFLLAISHLQQICLHHPACCCSSAKQKRQRSLPRPVSHPTLLPLSPLDLALATNLPASPSLLLQQCPAKTPTQPYSPGVTPHTAPPFSSQSLTCNKSACITQPAAAAVPHKNGKQHTHYSVPGYIERAALWLHPRVLMLIPFPLSPSSATRMLACMIHNTMCSCLADERAALWHPPIAQMLAPFPFSPSLAHTCLHA